MTMRPMQAQRPINSAIDIQLKSVWSALPVDAEMARSALRNIKRIFDIMQEERNQALRDAEQAIEQHNLCVRRYNDLAYNIETAQQVLRGEDIHEGCGY